MTQRDDQVATDKGSLMPSFGTIGDGYDCEHDGVASVAV